jgi:hypothetical protein
MLEVSIFPLSMIFLLDFGTVPPVLYFFVFHCNFHLLPLIEPTGMVLATAFSLDNHLDIHFNRVMSDVHRFYNILHMFLIKLLYINI